MTKRSAAPTLAPAARTGTPPAVLSVAVLGTGSIGTRHLEVLRAIDGVRPLAVPVRPQRRAELSKAGIETAESLQAAVRQGARLCVVATDTRRHVDDGLAALAQGLDVLMEKPLAVNAQEAHRLQEAARQHRRLLVVGCVLRFSESLNLFRAQLKAVGRVHAVRIECQSYLPAWRPARAYRESYSARADDGGVLRDLIHEIDYAGWLFGWPSALHARLSNTGRLRIAAEEMAEITWETADGGVVSLALDYLSQPPRRRMRACGEQGTLEWDGIAGTVTLMRDAAPAEERRGSTDRHAMFHAQAAAFIEASRGTRDPRLASGEDGVKALAVCDAVRHSALSRREEKVSYP